MFIPQKSLVFTLKSHIIPIFKGCRPCRRPRTKKSSSSGSSTGCCCCWAKSTTRKDLCVLMPFLPKIYYYFNCFRTGQPPTRVWETISRAGWSSSADAADNPLFAHMPYLWNLRPEHQRIWAHQKQTQTIQWPRVPPNGMACKVRTNDQFQLSCLPQRSAWKLPAGKQARKKSPARGKTTCPWIEGRHKSQTAPTKSLTCLFDKFYCLLPLLLQPRPKSLSRQPMRNTMPSVLSDREPQAMHGIKGIGRSSCGRTGNSFVFKPRGAEDPHTPKNCLTCRLRS